ncbi:hypothetical protein HAX54_017886, partial [Datura stramonium]|nr:hypothetical protein [Datura stramonium]
MKEEDAPSLPNNADDEDIEEGVEEENFKETFKGIFINNEVLEEVSNVNKGFGTYSFQSKKLDLD